MAYLDDYNNSQNTDFQYRVEVALVKIALDIQSESTSVTNHAARSTYALKVLANPSGYAKLMAVGFTAAGATNTSSTDTDLANRASAIWNGIAVQG